MVGLVLPLSALVQGGEPVDPWGGEASVAGFQIALGHALRGG